MLMYMVNLYLQNCRRSWYVEFFVMKYKTILSENDLHINVFKLTQSTQAAEKIWALCELDIEVSLRDLAIMVKMMPKCTICA